MKFSVSWILFLGVLLSGYDCPAALGQAQGHWTALPYLMPINPVHMALLYDGTVLVVSGSGNDPQNDNYAAAVWDPQGGTIATQPLGWDMFCNGMTVLPDGRPFIVGGTLQYDPFHGDLRTSKYSPWDGTFSDFETMAHGRWYPTVITLGDGTVMAFSGLTETGDTNKAVEIYTNDAGWSQEFIAPWTPPLYPRLHMLPDGTVFYSGPDTYSHIFDPATQTWTLYVAATNYSGYRVYGTSVLLPLTPDNGYDPVVMIMGGNDPATDTTELIDLGSSAPQWMYGPSMSQPRIEMNATILPNKTVVAMGGSAQDEDGSTASLNTDIYDPASNTFTTDVPNTYPRLYHSNALLLPDATVAVAGGNPARGTYEAHIEIYSPSYLFNSDGTPATRPAISGMSNGTWTYGDTFQVQTPDAASITSAVLIRSAAVTHAFNMDQRLVGLSFTAADGVLNITAPPNGNIAPPGYYMLFLVNSAGVPSVAAFVQVLHLSDLRSAMGASSFQLQALSSHGTPGQTKPHTPRKSRTTRGVGGN
jgi:hypothetical protein